VSTKSGSIFELELIKQYIGEHGLDPISNEPLTVDDLVAVKTTQTVMPPRQLNSIPQLLSSLQDEYDSIALEMFSLRKTLEDTRKELSTALYHHDAAVRVASRLLTERDEARKALEELTVSIAGDGVEVKSNNVQAVESSIPQDITDAIIQANQDLFALHKSQKNKINVDLAHVFESSAEIYNTKPYDSAISSSTSKQHIIITGKTGKTSDFDIAANKLIKVDSIGQSKDITAVLSLGNDQYIIGTQKGEVKLNKQAISTNHESSIVSILQHPSLSNLVITVDESGLFSLINIEHNSVIFNNRVTTDVIKADIHLDGALVAIGNAQGEIVIVDLKSGEVASNLKSNKNSSVIDLKFGSNGYWLFASYVGKTLEVWDLRKNTSFQLATNDDIKKITFDKSSQLILGVDTASKIEFIQYSKSDKSWILKNELKFDKLIDAVVVDDSEKNKLQIVTLSSNSKVARVEL
jgi:pre-mRNA-processing factor 19